MKETGKDGVLVPVDAIRPIVLRLIEERNYLPVKGEWTGGLSRLSHETGVNTKRLGSIVSRSQENFGRPIVEAILTGTGNMSYWYEPELYPYYVMEFKPKRKSMQRAERRKWENVPCGTKGCKNLMSRRAKTCAKCAINARKKPTLRCLVCEKAIRRKNKTQLCLSCFNKDKTAYQTYSRATETQLNWNGGSYSRRKAVT